MHQLVPAGIVEVDGLYIFMYPLYGVGTCSSPGHQLPQRRPEKEASGACFVGSPVQHPLSVTLLHSTVHCRAVSQTIRPSDHLRPYMYSSPSVDTTLPRYHAADRSHMRPVQSLSSFSLLLLLRPYSPLCFVGFAFLIRIFPQHLLLHTSHAPWL